MPSIQDTTPTSELDLVDEVLPANKIASLPDSGSQVQPPVCIKVIGPCHPTLVCSDIDQKNILSYSRQAGALLTAADETPQTFKAAISCSAKEIWMAAVNRELLSMKKLKVWEIVDLDPSYKLVGTTWVFKAKKNHFAKSLSIRLDSVLKGSPKLWVLTSIRHMHQLGGSTLSGH
ncbi:hypothetical protein O181_085075 [Austropuccinia psidii MF-1]|uniref:Reverse transcriptase Ty1/copia-type domain-containing protein n=1 Tax=Austropuccinia psidii MF-1 TaxID=1389203 RepID=A0A9Q3FWU8_9BASI|nr:hypothetical protein [Austropuccinia psidii MF-1]